MKQAPFVSSRSARKKLDAFADATLAQAQMWPHLQAVVNNHAESLVELQQRNQAVELVTADFLGRSFWLRLRWLVTGR